MMQGTAGPPPTAATATATPALASATVAASTPTPISRPGLEVLPKGTSDASSSPSVSDKTERRVSTLFSRLACITDPGQGS